MLGRESIPILARVLVRGAARTPRSGSRARRGTRPGQTCSNGGPDGLAHIEQAWPAGDHGQAGPNPGLPLQRTTGAACCCSAGELMLYLLRLGHPATGLDGCPAVRQALSATGGRRLTPGSISATCMRTRCAAPARSSLAWRRCRRRPRRGAAVALGRGGLRGLVGDPAAALRSPARWPTRAGLPTASWRSCGGRDRLLDAEIARGRRHRPHRGPPRLRHLGQARRADQARGRDPGRRTQAPERSPGGVNIACAVSCSWRPSTTRRIQGHVCFRHGRGAYRGATRRPAPATALARPLVRDAVPADYRRSAGSSSRRTPSTPGLIARHISCGTWPTCRPGQVRPPRSACSWSRSDGRIRGFGASTRTLRSGVGGPPGGPAGALAVHPLRARRGVARALLAAVERLAREAGAPVFAFQTASSMTGAIALYERLAYRRAPVRLPDGRPLQRFGAAPIMSIASPDQLAPERAACA